jgi:hypothetical protein
MALPNKGLYGDPIAPGAVGPRQVPSNPAGKAALAPLQVHAFCRIGKHPSAQMWNALQQSTNQAALYRTREYFSIVAPLYDCLNNPSTSDRDRWRFAFRTGVYMHAVYAVVAMVPTNAGFVHPTINTQANLVIYSDTAETTIVATATFSYGAHPGGTTGDWGFRHVKVIHGIIEGLTPDTEYYAKFIDVNVGRIQSATVFELQSMSENFSGYLNQNLTAQSEIYDSMRENVATLQKNLWKRGGAKVLNWTRDDGGAPLTRISATMINIIDNSSTAVSASTPGFTLDMTNKDRLSQTSGVPVVMYAFGKMGGAGTGSVAIKNSAGSTVATVTGFNGTASWKSIAFNLPATADKYDLHFASAGLSTLSLYAVSIYEHET